MELGKYILNLESIDNNQTIHPYHEIEKMILDLLNPITDYPKLIVVNKYYHELITNFEIYLKLKEVINHGGTFAPNKINNYCVIACILGHLEIAKSFYDFDCKLNNKRILISTFKLEKSCESGHFEVIKWLCELDPSIISKFSFKYACLSGNLEIVKYFFSKEFENFKINIHTHSEEPFIISCERGYWDIAKYLLSLEETHGKINVKNLNEKTFRKITKYNQFEIAKQVYSLGKNHGGIEICYEKLFIDTCINNQLDMAKCLYSIKNKTVDIRKNNDYLFHECCRRGHTEMVQWLCTLCDKYVLHFSTDDLVHGVINRKN